MEKLRFWSFVILLILTVRPAYLQTCSTLNCEQLCVNDFPSFCSCEIGYRISTTNSSACIDINECEENSNICANASQGNICINTEGGYFCSGCTSLSSSGNIWSYYNSSECCLRNTTSQCGRSINNEGRIVGGYPAAAGRWPWQAFLLIRGPANQGPFQCGGSLLTTTHVVTAAHCLRFSFGDAGSVEVRLGLLDVSGSTVNNVHEQSFTTSSFVIHPNYQNPTNDANDVAVLTLPRAAILGKYVNVICLPNGETPAVGDICYATGWGATSYQGPASQQLLEVDLPIVSSQACSAVYGSHIPESEICTGFPEGGKDTCQGDSGGPLVCQRCNSCDWYLVGITSYGFQCARANFPGVYARVSFFEPWIVQQTNQAAVTPQQCVKPSWSNWSPYTTCSVTCGNGTQTRNRTCNNGNPGVPGCFGNTMETQFCNMSACPVPCDPNPCQNGGTCSVVNNQASCTCPSNYTGNTCQTLIPTPCDPNPCQNGGTCSVVNTNQTSCSCPSNYTGNTCQTPVPTPCDPNPCKNGGTCSVVNNQASCTCPSTHTGDTCQTLIPTPCDPNPCQNGGTCSVVNNQASCTCPSNYTGNTCQTLTGVWSEWSTCAGVCGRTTQFRTRECSGNDVECSSLTREERPCSPCLGTWSTWTAVNNPCPVNCGGGRRVISFRECQGASEPPECRRETTSGLCNTQRCCDGLTDSSPGCCLFTAQQCQIPDIQRICMLACCRINEGLDCVSGGMDPGCIAEKTSAYCAQIANVPGACSLPQLQTLCPITCTQPSRCVCRADQSNAIC